MNLGNVMILGKQHSNDFGLHSNVWLLVLLNRFSCIIYVLQVKFLHLFSRLNRIFLLCFARYCIVIIINYYRCFVFFLPKQKPSKGSKTKSLLIRIKRMQEFNLQSSKNKQQLNK